jgi:large subunit ribosomal protein L5
MVTLRRERMWEFLDRLGQHRDPAHPRLPRRADALVRRSRQLHARLTEQIIFPEINYDKVDKIRGMDVTFVTTAKTDEEGRELLRLLQMPFRQAATAPGQSQGAAVAAGAGA